MVTTNKVADIIRKTCYELYQKSISSVYEYCNGLNLDYSRCEPCEAETPTIKTTQISECALCGQSK